MPDNVLPPPTRGPRRTTFIEEEHPDTRLRKVRSCALEEANYAVCQEMSAGRHITSEEQDHAVLLRARVFEEYLLNGYAAGMARLYQPTNPSDDEGGRS